MPAVARNLLVLALLLSALILAPASRGGLPAAEAATVVSDAPCRRIDPNLVRGACLRYQTKAGPAYTWIGTYRASNGRIFFCIDFLYDSRIAGRPSIISTRGLVNQMGQRIGRAEVAALNYLISTWASRGSTGSDTRDAAIALIIRQVMSDGVRPDGLVVYPRGLRVGGRVRPPIGGLGGPIMTQAQQMWSAASAYRGGYRVELSSADTGPVALGTSRRFLVSVISAAGRRVPGVPVRLRCSPQVTCPVTVTTRSRPVAVVVTPREVGEFTLRADAVGPAPGGRIYRVGGWRTHGGTTAADRGIQRGWIAETSTMKAQVRASVEIVKGTPEVVTRASDAVAVVGTPLHDIVTVSRLPVGSQQQVTATLFGPFPQRPGPDSCAAPYAVGSVVFTVESNGEFITPSVVVHRPGYYVWTESLPGDELTNPVTTPCGVVAETTQVLARTPVVRTEIASGRALVGQPIFDQVLVSGWGEGDRATLRWTLLGPLAPRDGSCRGLDWSRARVLARGQLEVTRNGSYRTAPVLVRQPGCVTYAGVLDASATTTEVVLPPGVAAETGLITRPVTPVVPEIPSGPGKSRMSNSRMSVSGMSASGVGR